MTPSAPSANALRIKAGSMRPVHMTRMISTFGGCSKRDTPAVSDAV
jgi:hypothetical protein